RPRALLLIVAAAGLAGSPAAGAWSDAAPRATDNGAYLDLYGALEHDEQSNDFRSFSWTDTFFRERLTVYSNGFVYDPRFLLYQLSLSAALKQENFDASYLSNTGWQHGTGYEYDTRLIFLSEHPYNLELFALRYEPLFKEQAATHRDSLQTSWGG